MSNTNPFDFSEYGMNKGAAGPPSGDDPFATPPVPAHGPSAPGAPPPAPRPPAPATSDPFGPSASATDPFMTAGSSDGTPFGSTANGGSRMTGPAATLSAAKPPFALLLVALALAIVAGVVAVALNHVVVAFVCWFVAGPIAIGLLAWFVRKDTYARSGGLYAAPGFVRPLYWIAVIGCLMAIWAPAWRIADWVGHL